MLVDGDGRPLFGSLTHSFLTTDLLEKVCFFLRSASRTATPLSPERHMTLGRPGCLFVYHLGPVGPFRSCGSRFRLEPCSIA